MAPIELRGIGKAYGAATIIDALDLTLDDGMLTVFVGPSGCGKSTLLRMIAGLESISRGEVRIGGRRANEATPTQRGVAMVFQNYALYPHLTVRNNIGFPLRMAGMKRDEIARKVGQAAARLRIEPLLDRKPAALSGGQRQRVAIGRAIVRDPDIFLFDEPLSNLDAELRVQMRLEIASLHKALDATMIYVTHDQVEAMTLADRIVVLRAGRVEQSGTPMALYDDPDNMFVAGFIGSPRMNLLHSRVTARVEGGVTVTLRDLDAAPVAVRVASPPEPGTDVVLGLRPEAFSPKGDVAIRVTADAVENLGGTAYGYVQLGDGDPLTIDLGGDRTIRAGSSVTTAFESGKALLFDPKTEHRIR
ncbi:carbohydrate ABC transporter ATP-binding protein (CUT1 family) [Rhizobium sp. PP-F2F-G38]|uniref:ABC transporter ATP-binding protein n=1 Tax=Rhizobium sp. PP-CC-3G-465 TaxID=2135648 RepID=UPI000D93E2C8|nr:carbohydrate ABC transporter ATP-binding protein (CUT1 family) [Rhizobium sp. PP-WC-1G-195]PYE93314.1 carbohydrate ABC transporter ATP-binding protein (CUT1 family) [Rhizobium sp. PP-F2F-G38]TCL89423.1 lactose/L-arabinose transport system ATP-binding protein [Rhizobium sp. PP-WC-2G-219]TCP75334.1 carbohydrate ABC transporter ATP-binding protein (CUT1 family) [Rhizobium sp. PP-CC-2G-626]TCQ02559.1 carbohydrate ABC transporter ATP-binding protein (CUT1 family) [Rhizobium sp. PP-F2F-G36]TCQ172